MLGLPCCYNPKTTANRIAYLFCLFGAIILTSVLSSGLIQFIMTPILSPQIQSVQEINSEDFKFMSDRFAFEKIVQQKKVFA